LLIAIYSVVVSDWPNFFSINAFSALDTKEGILKAIGVALVNHPIRELNIAISTAEMSFKWEFEQLEQFCNLFPNLCYANFDDPVREQSFPQPMELSQRLPKGLGVNLLIRGQNVLTKCLSTQTKHFDIAQARELIKLGANPNLRLPPFFSRPILCCTTLEAAQFMIVEAGADLSFHAKVGNNTVHALTAIIISLPVEVSLWIIGTKLKDGNEFLPNFSLDDLLLCFREILDLIQQSDQGYKFVSLIKSPEVAALGAHINITHPKTGETILHRCCAYGSFEILPRLFELGADANIRSATGLLPLEKLIPNSGHWVSTAFKQICSSVLDKTAESVNWALETFSYGGSFQGKTSLLHLVCIKGLFDVLQRAVETADPAVLKPLLLKLVTPSSGRYPSALITLAWSEEGVKYIPDIIKRFKITADEMELAGASTVIMLANFQDLVPLLRSGIPCSIVTFCKLCEKLNEQAMIDVLKYVDLAWWSQLRDKESRLQDYICQKKKYYHLALRLLDSLVSAPECAELLQSFLKLKQKITLLALCVSSFPSVNAAAARYEIVFIKRLFTVMVDLKSEIDVDKVSWALKARPSFESNRSDFQELLRHFKKDKLK
jgi:hypothetical protein